MWSRLLGISYQVINEVYRTMAAITTVRIKPGTRPRIEYDQGKDIIARQIYSEKSNAAVCKNLLVKPLISVSVRSAPFANCTSGI